MAAKLTEEERTAILDDIRTGTMSRNAIARKHGRSVGTVTNLARDADTDEPPFDRSLTKNATRARVADSASRRAQLAADMLDDVEFFRAKFRQEWTKTVVIPGPQGSVEQVVADSAEVASGLQRLMTAVGIAVDKHIALDKHDADDSSAGAAVDAWLRAMLGGNGED